MGSSGSYALPEALFLLALIRREFNRWMLKVPPFVVKSAGDLLTGPRPVSLPSGTLCISGVEYGLIMLTHIDRILMGKAKNHPGLLVTIR
jgi:hypothetical protein